jgi:hypothetical protein
MFEIVLGMAWLYVLMLVLDIIEDFTGDKSDG